VSLISFLALPEMTVKGDKDAFTFPFTEAAGSVVSSRPLLSVFPLKTSALFLSRIMISASFTGLPFLSLTSVSSVQ